MPTEAAHLKAGQMIYLTYQRSGEITPRQEQRADHAGNPEASPF